MLWHEMSCHTLHVFLPSPCAAPAPALLRQRHPPLMCRSGRMATPLVSGICTLEAALWEPPAGGARYGV